MNILKIFFQYSVPFPVADGVDILMDVDDDGDDAGTTGLNLPFLLPPPIQERKPKYREHLRDVIWEEQVTKCRHIGDFVETYKMTEASFNVLVDLLAPDLQVNEAKSRNSTAGVQPIDARLIVAAGLRFLGGESYRALRDIFHFSIPSSKRIVRKFLDAVIANLDIYLPTSDEELEALAAGWTQKSSADGCYHGLLLALDGYLSTRTVPDRTECPNASDFFSGHKKLPAVNVQAAVDHMLRFRYIAVASPGKVNDGRAFLKCRGLLQWLQILDPKFYICADNAYPLSNQILVPFKGAQAIPIYNSSYNFYLSQLRIRVELAFGRMTTKFRILRTKMTCKVATQSKIIQAVARLHNFIIDNDKPPLGAIRLNADGTIAPGELERFGVEPLPVGEEDGQGPEGNLGFLGFHVLHYANEGASARRQAIVNELAAKEIHRPLGPL